MNPANLNPLATPFRPLASRAHHSQHQSPAVSIGVAQQPEAPHHHEEQCRTHTQSAQIPAQPPHHHGHHYHEGQHHICAPGPFSETQHSQRISSWVLEQQKISRQKHTF